MIIEMGRTKPPKLLNERYLLESRSFLIRPYHFLFGIFDRKLRQYIEADLVNYNGRDFRRLSNPKGYEKATEPFAVLTLEELEAGFVVFMVLLVSSILMFAIEWLPTFKDLMVFLYIFKKYFDIKQFEQFEHSKAMTAKMFEYQKIILKIKLANFNAYTCPLDKNRI